MPVVIINNGTIPARHAGPMTDRRAGEREACLVQYSRGIFTEFARTRRGERSVVGGRTMIGRSTRRDLAWLGVSLAANGLLGAGVAAQSRKVGVAGRREADEPRLSEMLGDPIIKALMTRDGVSDADILAVITTARKRLGL